MDLAHLLLDWNNLIKSCIFLGFRSFFFWCLAMQKRKLILMIFRGAYKNVLLSVVR